MNNLNETIKLLKQQRASVRMTYLVLTGTMVVAILFIILLLISYFLIENSYVLARIFAGLVALLYLVCAAVFARKGLIKLAAWMLIGLYTALGIFILATWGLNAPVGILVLGFVILLSSVMLDSRSIIFVSIIISIGLVLIQLLNINNVITPDTSRLDQQSTPGDAATYVIIFSIFALISWLSKRKMEETLLRARAAERALKLERDQLTERIKKQMTALQRAQQNELKQLYKFAELGQLTTIILHELANYLSVLTLDIDNLEDRHENSIAISRAKESIFYIDTIIDQVRNQIKESDETVNFDALKIMKESIDQLRKKLTKANLRIFVEDNKKSQYTVLGDPLRLSQAITILATNAVEASFSSESEVSIEISSVGRSILISVKNFGRGIPSSKREQLFKPQKSTKETGLGIGLYVTKQIIETHFKGRLWLSPATEYTQFNIEIPKIKS